MKKIIVILCLMLVTACSTNANDPSEEVFPENQAAPCVMINNRMYHTTGELYDGRFYDKANEEDYDQQFEVDGTITSTVAGYELPEENDQSNFGTGYEYHIVDEDNVLVKDVDLWIRFERVFDSYNE